MPTHDMVINNAVGATVRSDINSALAALVANSSNATEPATMYAYQIWFDTSAGYMKQRNSTNTAWVALSVAPATAAAHAIRLDQVPNRLWQIVETKLSTASTGTTQIPVDNTIPQNTEGDQYLTATITPINASSRLEIEVVLWASHNIATAADIIIALFKDTTANAVASSYASSPQYTMIPKIIKFSMAAGTTSATIFKVRAGPGSAGTVTVNGVNGGGIFGGTMVSSITIKEYLP